VTSGRRFHSDPALNHAQRNYLRRFDEFLADPSPMSVARRLCALESMLVSAGVEPEGVPRRVEAALGVVFEDLGLGRDEAVSAAA
jgi:hypothetical protein